VRSYVIVQITSEMNVTEDQQSFRRHAFHTFMMTPRTPECLSCACHFKCAATG
jgi:hypothetical protein